MRVYENETRVDFIGNENINSKKIICFSNKNSKNIDDYADNLCLLVYLPIK